MRITVYSHYFVPEIGAPPARIYDLSQQWIRRGHQVQVVTCFPNHPSGRLHPGYSLRRHMQEALDGIDVHRHWTYITPNKGFLRKGIGHFSFLPAARLFSDRRLAPMDAAVGTSPTFFAAMAAASAARRRKIPFIMEVRDLWPAIFVELGVLKNPAVIRRLEKWELWLYRRAARIVTVTESFRANLISRGVPARKVATVPNGADIEYWRPGADGRGLRRQLGLQGKFVVLYMGAHGISHALGRVLECAQRLRDRPEIQFLFVGDGAEKKQLVRQAEQARLPNAHFLDPIGKEEVRRFYAMADLCLVPLRNIPLFDTFLPSKMFEIMAMGRPILASLRGEAAGILNASGGAVVVEPEDVEGLAHAVVKLHGREEELEGMGRAGRAFAAAHYSRSALAAKYLEVLQAAVEERRHTGR